MKTKAKNVRAGEMVMVPGRQTAVKVLASRRPTDAERLGGGQLVLPVRRERLTAAQATVLAKREFGEKAFAATHKGQRRIWMSVSDICISFLGQGSTWLEAFSQARATLARKEVL